VKTKEITTEILIVGGGASGVCAGIQAARMGANVVLVEETHWLGGMLTAAGVSAIDGNHNLPSGLWGDFRERLYQYYGGADAVATGWVSNTLFEPHVGNSILQDMVNCESNISVIHNFWIINALKEENVLKGAEFKNDKNEQLIVHAEISIDATEYGDLLALAGCEYRLGRDSQRETGESFAPDIEDEYIQDLTYVAILKDFGEGSDRTIPKPKDYDPDAFINMCEELGENPDKKLWSKEKMLEYGRLPNNKFMINWPINGNDCYLDLTEMDHDQRIQALQAAKDFTLRCVYHIQTRLGKKNLGLADDEFPTKDKLALIPYIRESRRVKGKTLLTTDDILQPYSEKTGEKYKDGIAVGDYPLDHHHDKSPVHIEENFPDIPAFNAPYGCLVPDNVEGLLVAEKSISVTHLVNGCTRLQPVVMQIGQAAGTAAALCVRNHFSPVEINIRELQQILLETNCWLMPFLDISPSDWAFQSVQRIGLCGIIKGEPIPKSWANEMRFHPEKEVSVTEALEALKIATKNNFKNSPDVLKVGDQIFTRADAVNLIWQSIECATANSPNPCFKDVNHKNTTFQVIQYFSERGWLKNMSSEGRFIPDKKISRKEFAYLIDKTINPFQQSLKLE